MTHRFRVRRAPLPSTAARGYGPAHQRLRERWKPVVDAGNAYCQAARCLMGDRWIPPGAPWHLGHTADRSGYLGPCHARCNVIDGAQRGGKTRRAPPRRRARWVTSRQW